jgi:transmembrane sensor
VTRRNLLITGASFGTLAAALGAVAVSLWHSRQYTTEVGEVRRVPLADGSVATLNTQSSLEIRLQREERQLNLARGEVWFEVAKDTTRPFIVRAGLVSIRALGTAFSVRRREESTDVLVTEGVVEAWVQGAAGHKIRLPAGTHATLTAAGTAEVKEAPSVVQRTLAWREGEIALEGETLSEAVVEFNRYNTRKLIIDDPELAKALLVGHFRATEPEAFARAVSSTLGAQVTEGPNTLTLSRP